MNKFWSPLVNNLTPYVPGEQPKTVNLIKLNTNENPFGPSPKVLKAMEAELEETLRLYPDPECTRLKKAVADLHKVQPCQVFVGNGSDEVLAHTFQALLKHDQPILFPDITYSFYPVYCQLYQIEYQTVPLTDTFEVRWQDYAQPNGGILFANPNAPTGRLLALSEVTSLLEMNTNSVVVVDEAYVDFGGESATALVERFPNLLVIHTFSKSRSLAGLRVGFAVGHKDLIEALERVKNSFNSYPLDRLAITGAVAAIQDSDYFDKTRQAIIQTRTTMTKDLTSLGFKVLPSSANFVFAEHPDHDAQELAAKLRQKAIIVRHFKLDRISQFLRITVGNDEQTQALHNALTTILS